MANNSDQPHLADNSWRQRSVILIIVVLLLAGIYLIFGRNGEHPDYYQPARSSITYAEVILSETYNEEKTLLQQLQIVHQHLDQVIALLGKAEKLDPADQKKLGALREKLQDLESQNIMSANLDDVKQNYDSILRELQALTQKSAQ